MVSPWKHDLNTFINIVHVSKSSFKRKICGSEFAEYDVMERYMDAAYEGKRSFKYNICDLSLIVELAHDNKKPFKRKTVSVIINTLLITYFVTFCLKSN